MLKRSFYVSVPLNRDVHELPIANTLLDSECSARETFVMIVYVHIASRVGTRSDVKSCSVLIQHSEDIIQYYSSLVCQSGCRMILINIGFNISLFSHLQRQLINSGMEQEKNKC